jgi:sugar lactone lactonase YvrE
VLASATEEEDMKVRSSWVLVTALSALAVGCSSGAEEAQGDSAETGGEAPRPATERVRTYTGFSTPESVLYDADQDVYFVSNVDGSPLAKDDQAFIAKLSPDGSVLAARFIDAAAEGVTLNAPKGMAIVGDQLYVSDIDTVRVFDRHDGHAIGEIPIAGASFLNDVAVCPEGHVFVTDSGLTATASGFGPTGTDAIYRVELGAEPVQVASGETLGRPNGIAITDDAIYVVTFGAAELLTLSHEGAITARTTLPAGGLDGLVLLPGGDFLVSSWEASAVFRGRPGGEFRPVVEGVGSPADLGFDTRRSLLLVPLFVGNEVAVYAVP